MLGAFLNGLGILAGALLGLTLRQPLTVRTQEFLKSALGAFVFFYGLRLIYENADWTGYLWLREILIAILGVVMGYWVGRLLRLQSLSNRIGQHASLLLAAAQKNPPGPPAAGFLAATMLFCAAPLGFLGAVADGLKHYPYLLMLKGIMDGLAMMSFVRMFRWPVALSAVPVFFFFNGLTLLAQVAAKAYLDGHHLSCFVGVAAGLVTCVVALVIFGVRRVDLANYLPALVVAPLLGHWLG